MSNTCLTAEEFMKKATSEQKELLFQLACFADKEKILSEEINKISSASGIYINDRNITIYEDSDDVKIISAQLISELTTVRHSMANMLRRVREEFNMSNVGIISRQWENYKKFI